MKRFSQISDILIPVILIALAGSVALSVWRLPDVSTSDDVGPRLFPYGLALLLAVFSGLLFLGVAPAHTRDSDISLRGMVRRFLPLLFFCVLYVIAMPLLGFLLATSAFLVASFILMGESRLWLNVLIAVGCSSATYLLFATGLGIQLSAFPG